MSADPVVVAPSRGERRGRALSHSVLKEEIEQFLYRQAECLDTRD
jgi:hypothetical protein